MPRVLRMLALAGLPLLLAGCLKLGPDYQKPKLRAGQPGAYQHAGGLTAWRSQNRWWRAFGSSELNALVAEALAHNLDLRRSYWRVREVGADLVRARSPRFPLADLQGGWQRQRTPRATSTIPFAFEQETTTWNLALAASFEVDLWGRLARAEEAARADLLAAEANRRTVAQTIVASVVSTWLEIQAVERRLQVNQALIEARRRSVELITFRYQRGLVSVLDYRQARRDYENARARVPDLRRELGLAQQRLRVLLGRYPKTRPARSHRADYFKLLPPVPPGLPSGLLLRRPDLIEAQSRLRALNARVGEALARRFPAIRLTGSYGHASRDLSNMFSAGSELWSLASGLSQSLFDAGALRAGQRAAEARFKQGLADYAKTVLTAFSEVEGALLTRKRRLEQRRRTLVALKEAVAAQQEAESRYERGLVDYLNVITTQTVRFNIEDQLVLIELAILSNRVTLHRVLGGGWDGLRPVMAP